ncbi:MAG: hypothetical protein J2P36_16060 [Ktedonobacteraceae bacterium]|nr:hypothetical protein [Ktedonobacteraceae bacterium]
MTPNLLNRAFSAAAPNTKWVSDTTYVWTAEGWLYSENGYGDALLANNLIGKTTMMSAAVQCRARSHGVKRSGQYRLEQLSTRVEQLPQNASTS